MNAFSKAASFARWRLKPNRWLGKLIYGAARFGKSFGSRPQLAVPASAWADELHANGYLDLGKMAEPPHIDLEPHAGDAKGAAFVDIRESHRDIVDPFAIDLLADPKIGAMIAAYFGGRPWLWNIALNYSEPSDRLLDSQLWHFDYGDDRQLHLLVHFTDVTEDSGPFTFLPRQISEQVTRHPLVIERKTDEDLKTAHGIDPARHVIRLIGERGRVFVNDPGFLMHQGARCRTQRLVLFITFTTSAPMSKGGRGTIDTTDRLRIGRMYAEAAPNGPVPPSAFR